MSSTQRLELEIDLLEAKKAAIESDFAYKVEQYNSSMPCDEGMSDNSVAVLIMSSLGRDRDRLTAEIAEKKLARFDLLGVDAANNSEPSVDNPQPGQQPETSTSPPVQLTHAEGILRAAAFLAGADRKGVFTRKQVGGKIGVSSREWHSGYTAIFQSMRDDQPGGAPPVASRYKATLHRVAHGSYQLTARGRHIVSELDSPSVN